LGAGKLPFIQSLPYLVKMTDNLEFKAGTVTRPQHATMFSGYLADVTGIWSNDPTKNYSPPAENGGLKLATGYSVFERVRAWFWMNKPYVAGGTGKVGNVGDMLGFPKQGTYQNIFGFNFFNNGWGLLQDYPPDMYPKRNATEMSLAMAENKPPYFYMVHFADPDHVGHTYDVNSPQYRDAIVACDRVTGQICQKLSTSNPAIIVTSDHGFGCCVPTSHGGTPNSFLASNLPIVRDAYEVDVTPTIYEYLGIPYEMFYPKIQGISLMRTAPTRVEVPLIPLSKEQVMFGHEF